MPLFYETREVAHVLVAFADVHIIANAHNVGHKANHVGGFAGGFAMGHLGFAFFKVLDFEPQQVAGRDKTEASAGGIVPENRDA